MKWFSGIGRGRRHRCRFGFRGSGRARGNGQAVEAGVEVTIVLVAQDRRVAAGTVGHDVTAFEVLACSPFLEFP